MRVVIFGRTGQVARELGLQAWPADADVLQLGRADCDLASLGDVRRTLLESRPDVVINAAAYTAVDRAESQPAVARQINADAPATMAQMCGELGSALIHLSTDYVFDGTKPGAYLEDDPIHPLSVYGETKARGEAEIRAALQSHVILRTTWVFAAHGTNFVRTILRLSTERPEIGVVADQLGGPTSARDIASAVRIIVETVMAGRATWGTYHYTSAEPTSWYGFAQAIVEQAGKSAVVRPIGTADYPTAARRPLNSVLDCGLVRTTYGIEQPNWRHALSAVLAEVL